MEDRLVMQTMQDYTLQNMREREQKIKGSTSIATIDGISTATANPTIGGEVVTTRAQENEELATYGNKKSALKNIKESYKILNFKLEQIKSNMEKAKANLKFEEKAEALKEQIDKAVTPTERENLQKQLEDLKDDNDYYTLKISRIENELNENANQQARLEALFDTATPDSETVLTARDILNLDPVARMRMLDPNNFDNYSKKQQTQIKKANAELSKNGLDFSDIQNQALATSRYIQREAMLEDVANNEAVRPSFRTTVTNMIDAAKQIIDSNIKQYVRKSMKEIKDNSATKEEATAMKLDLLRGYSSSKLRYIKDGLTKADQKLVDEILPMAETGEQLIDLIHNENYGLTGLNMDERRNLQSVVANTMSQSRTAEELIDNLATKSVDTLTPSINTLLDKLGQVYEQQHSTIVETAKEKAQRQANERRAAQAREQAAQAAIAPAENAPSVTPVSKEKKQPHIKQLSEFTFEGTSAAGNYMTGEYKVATDNDGFTKINHEGHIYHTLTKADIEALGITKEELLGEWHNNAERDKEWDELDKISIDKVVIRPNGEVYIEIKGIQDFTGLEGVAAEKIAKSKFPSLFGKFITKTTKTDTELIQEAKNIILATQAQVQPTAERDPHADHYLINGEKYTRVHSAMGDVWVGPNSPNKEANSARSLKNGSIVDGIVRDFFDGITPVKPDNFSDEAFASLMTSLETIKAKLIENGEEFLTNNIVLYHKFPNGVKIAGEADIVSVKIVNGKPQYNIYDLKTSAGGRDGKAFNESPFWETNPTAGARNTVIGTREQYTNQVSLYKLLFERMLNTPVTNLALLPYKLTYDAENNVTGIEKYPGIVLTYNPNVEKLIAYQPAIDEAISRIQHTYKGMFTKEQLATLKGIIANGIIKREAFGKDVAYFINNQGLESQFKEVGMGELSPIIKDLKEAVSSIDVAETLKEEFKEPEPLPTPTPPAELATVEPTGIEYSPTKESFTEPDVDAEFNVVGEDAGSTQLQQTQDVTEEFTDIDLTTNAIEDKDINEETGEVAATIKGNAMSPYVYEDKTAGIEDENRRDAQRGILVPKTAGPSMQNFNDWMQARKIDLQGLIDDKLSDILSTGTKDNPVKIFFMRVNPNMTATGGQLMNGHYLLVVEDTPALRKVYTQTDADKYGDFVTANGKKYLIVGTAGFANTSQGNAYRNIFTKGSNSVQVKSNAYFKANANEEFYVDQDKYTHVARIHSGFIIKQLATDSMPQVRRLSELLNDSERNPQGLTWDSLVFGYQMKNEFRTVPDVDPSMYHAPAKAMHNIGNVFLYIKGADGRYTPTMLIPTRYSEINQGTLNTKIDNALRMLTSLDHAQRYQGLLALYNLIVLGQKDNNGAVTGTDILIGTDKIPTLTFKLDGNILYTTDLKNVNFQEVLENFARLNPRINITKNKLLSEETLKELDAAGALRTDIARLGKASGDYSIYNIGSDGKPIITDAPVTSSNAEIVRGEARRIRVDEQYFSKMGDNYIDERGNLVTDNTLLESIKLNDFILNTNMDASITIGTTEYFIPNMNDTQSIIAREVGTHKAHIVTDAVQINSVKQFIQKEKAEAAQASRDAAASAELEGVTPIVETAPVIPAEQTPQTPADPISSIMDLLNMDTEKEKPVTPNSTPTASESSTSSQDINITERKSLIDADNSVKNGTFAGEKDAFSIMQDETFQDAVLDECERLWPETADMGLGEIVEFLKSKGKVTTGIKDVKTWIDTLKC